jgi:hypothetical protein
MLGVCAHDAHGRRRSFSCGARLPRACRGPLRASVARHETDVTRRVGDNRRSLPGDEGVRRPGTECTLTAIMSHPNYFGYNGLEIPPLSRDAALYTSAEKQTAIAARESLLIRRPAHGIGVYVPSNSGVWIQRGCLECFSRCPRRSESSPVDLCGRFVKAQLCTSAAFP